MFYQRNPDLFELVQIVKNNPISEEAWTNLIQAAHQVGKYIVVPSMHWQDMYVISWEDDLPVPRVIGHLFVPKSSTPIIDSGPEGSYVRRRTSHDRQMIVSSMTTVAAGNLRLVDKFSTNPIYQQNPFCSCLFPDTN